MARIIDGNEMNMIGEKSSQTQNQKTPKSASTVR